MPLAPFGRKQLARGVDLPCHTSVNHLIINQMRKDVEAYEEAVHRQAILAEQARLKERAARELGNKADSIRGRNSKRRR